MSTEYDGVEQHQFATGEHWSLKCPGCDCTKRRCDLYVREQQRKCCPDCDHRPAWKRRQEAQA